MWQTSSVNPTATPQYSIGIPGLSGATDVKNRPVQIWLLHASVCSLFLLTNIYRANTCSSNPCCCSEIRAWILESCIFSKKKGWSFPECNSSRQIHGISKKENKYDVENERKLQFFWFCTFVGRYSIPDGFVSFSGIESFPCCIIWLNWS